MLAVASPAYIAAHGMPKSRRELARHRCLMGFARGELPQSQWTFTDYQRSLVVRSNGDAAALAPSVRDAIWSVDKDQPVDRIATAETLVARTAASRRFALVLFELFAMVALLLAAAGIYGVLIGSVTEALLNDLPAAVLVIPVAAPARQTAPARVLSAAAPG